MDSNSILHFIQLSDFHLGKDKDFIYHGTKPYQSLQNIVRHIQKTIKQVDFLLLSGDLADDRSAEVYYYVNELLKPLQIPYYWLAGNHDNPELMQSLADKVSVINQKSFVVKGVKFILLNSVEPNNKEDYGEFTEKEWKFLEEELTNSVNLPCIIALHHHPFEVGCSLMDNLMLKESDKFLKIMDKFSHIRAVIFGHIHAEWSLERNKVWFLSCPSTTLQFKIQEPFALDDKTPGYRVFELNSEGKIQTKILRL